MWASLSLNIKELHRGVLFHAGVRGREQNWSQKSYQQLNQCVNRCNFASIALNNCPQTGHKNIKGVIRPTGVPFFCGLNYDACEWLIRKVEGKKD